MKILEKLLGKEKKERKPSIINLSDRYYIDITSKPYLLFDRKGMVLNGKHHPLGICCNHAIGTDGICSECW
ncbi:MAG: hypothetical protein ACOC5T_07095, partial [Elusimicrobiota bacterium]